MCLPLYHMGMLLEYYGEVHQGNLEILSNMSTRDMGGGNGTSGGGKISMNAAFRLLITHSNNHHGQIDYLRGLL